MAQKIFFGTKDEIPVLPDGELGFATDTKEMFVGTSLGNKQYTLGTDVQGASYSIELDKWGIRNDGTEAAATTNGINGAIGWAKSIGISHVFLPRGTYLVKPDPISLSAIVLPSGMHLEMAEDCVIQMETNSSPNYNVIEMRKISGSKVSGGKIIGDKKTHQYELSIKFVRGGVNPDGSLNNDPNWIRSEVLDRYEHPGLLRNFRLWKIEGVNAANYHFYQYKDNVSTSTLAGFRTNGIFAPAGSTGRGWFLGEEGIEENNKMVFTINISSSPLTDAQISEIAAKVDNSYWTHEFGMGIGLYGANDIEIANIEILDCTGDGIFTGWAEYHLDPNEYTQGDMGQRIYIYGCNIHHCRRQGISITSTNDTHIYNNQIHDIGYDDDGKTTNFRNGTAPMFGTDIESMVGESNIPYKTPENPVGLELNYRIYINQNHIYNNARGHFVNTDGTHITLEGNTFEGYNVGGISSNPNQKYIKYLNNTFINCELWVQGDNFINGADFHNGNLRFFDVRGATVQNCKLTNGMMYGSIAYGYFGTPTVDKNTGTFTYSIPHGMGNGARISFEQWVGRVPTGISVDKLYYTVNVTSKSFQVSEAIGGTPVSITDEGQPGFNIGRFNYGRCLVTNISLERDWRPDNAATRNINLWATGAVFKNISVKNYDVSIIVPPSYVGRPNIIEGMTLIEGAARFESSIISNSNFIRAKTNVLGMADIHLGFNDPNYTRKVTVRGCFFQNIGIILDGNALLTEGTLLNSSIGKADTNTKSIVTLSYLENSKINLYWMTKEKSVSLVRNVFNGVTISGRSPYVVMVDNTDLTG